MNTHTASGPYTGLKAEIFSAAVDLARTRGYRHFTQYHVAEKAKTAKGTVTYHFKSMERLRIEVMRHAIRAEILEIIAQGLAERHAVVLQDCPEALRRRAARVLSGIDRL
jgi:AcrR family transcriptional regulator